MNDLDDLLVDALRADAERAPTMPDEWDLGSRPFVVPRRARRWELIAAVAAATVLVAVGAVWLGRGGSDDGPAGPASTWRPSGTEFPLVDLGPADRALTEGPVPVALTRRLRAADVGEVLASPALMYAGGETADLVWCVGAGDEVQCRGDYQRPSWSLALTSVMDASGTSRDLLIVEGLPSEVAFVTYDRDVRHVWQRPIVGIVVLPGGPGLGGAVVGYDLFGRAVGHYDLETLGALSSNDRADVGMSERRFSELRGLTRSALFDCIHSFGGLVNDHDLATFPAGVDQQKVWEECVSTTKRVVAEHVAALSKR